MAFQLYNGIDNIVLEQREDVFVAKDEKFAKIGHLVVRRVRGVIFAAQFPGIEPAIEHSEDLWIEIIKLDLSFVRFSETAVERSTKVLGIEAKKSLVNDVSSFRNSRADDNFYCIFKASPIEAVS